MQILPVCATRVLPSLRFRCGISGALPDIEQALIVEKNGGFKPLLQRLNTLYLDWPEQTLSPFFNINTPQDLALAETLLCP